MKESAHRKALLKHGADILFSPSMQSEKHFLQHGRVSVFTHSIAAACTCICIARILRARLGIRLNERALIRGALLHDIFSTTGIFPTEPTVSMLSFMRGGPSRMRPGISPWEKSSAT